MKKSKAVSTSVLLADESVVLPTDEDEHRLEISCEDDVLDFRIDGKVIFRGDWILNFREVFMEAINYFPQPHTEKAKA